MRGTVMPIGLAAALALVGVQAAAGTAQLPLECVQVADGIICAPPGTHGPPVVLCWTPDAESRRAPPFDSLPDGAEICGLILLEQPDA